MKPFAVKWECWMKEVKDNSTMNASGHITIISQKLLKSLQRSSKLYVQKRDTFNL